MSLISRLNSLIRQHSIIEQSIKSANDNHVSNLEIQRLKKEKLKIKEEIDSIEKLI